MSGIIAQNAANATGLIKAAAAGGAWTLLSTSTASSSSDVSITSNIDSTYPIYKFEFINIHPSADSNQFLINFSDDGGSSYDVTKTSSVFRAYQNEAGNDTAFGYTTSNDLANGTGVQLLASSLGADADHTTQGSLWLFNPANTTFYKHYICRITTNSSDDEIMDFFVAGYCNTTSAVNAAQFSMSSGNIDAGTIKLYGLGDS